MSEQLGLTIDGGVGQDHLRIHGDVKGAKVELWFGTHATHTRARVPHPAPIALRLVSRSWLGRLFGIGSGIGDAAFDKRLKLVDGPREQVAAALSPELRSELVAAARQRLHPTLLQDRVELRMFSNGGGDDPAKIVRLLETTARLGTLADAAFAR